jgi:hypothetical protein
MKGIKGPMEEIRIPLKPDARPVKQRPYRLNPKYVVIPSQILLGITNYY